jgi:dihydrofolate reductase
VFSAASEFQGRQRSAHEGHRPAQPIEHDLVDEYRLMIEPVLLGGGKPLFPDDGQARALELVSATTTGTGVLICTYRPAGNSAE